MAAVARKNLSAYPNVEIVVSSFEDWDLQGREKSFDFVVSATAFHWVDEKVRMLKAADALRDGDGALAVISTHHVKGGSEGFFAEVQPFYERCGLAASFGMCLPAASNIAEDASEFERSGRFGPVEFRRYEWDEIYSTGEYLGLLLTYSNHRCLEEGARKELFDSIAELIDGKYQGRISKRYMAQLALAKKLC
ncbi:hypothetical protein G7Y89_g11186 [Cudoniella acicularis]|uniref:Methyltransferase type 11 domain-containing protein n=1 Tax=Cudoniella acicularis TaxID=354080 RepID=A0A8H4RE49_9HELO|nr:hypothetical protein G7Y89_g11186 [Cudoniella acicularis]